MMKMNEKIMQISSGKGPAECERVVAKLLAKIHKAAEQEQVRLETLELVPGRQAQRFLSVLLRVSGETAEEFCSEWEGTIRWVAPSPFRRHHKRKNWFAGISVFDVSAFPAWNEKDIMYQSMRASGPGGQHVNKTESAVRAIHLPSGISVTASEERSQSMNRQAATARLKSKWLALQVDAKSRQQQSQWLEHHSLERGNAAKVFRESLE